LATIDPFAGLIVEPEPGAADTDEANAKRRVEQIIRLKHDIAADARLTKMQVVEATGLLRQLRAKAESLVRDSMAEIMTTAAALSRPTKYQKIGGLMIPTTTPPIPLA